MLSRRLASLLGLARLVGSVLLLPAFPDKQLIADHLTDDLLGQSLGFVSGMAHGVSSPSADASLAGWTASGPAVERWRWATPQRFRKVVLAQIGQRVAAHIGCKLRALMRRLVLAEPALDVHASDGIVHAVLDIPGIGHG